MTAKLIEILIMEGIAVLMLWLGYLIGIKKKMELIAGYNKKSSQHVTNKAGLARLIGRLCLLIGIASAVMPIATSIWGVSTPALNYCIGAYGGFIAGVIGLTMLQARDYTEK
ncbi:MAG: DUF3784 domain-containing protein [Gammaproteobacteria bacterium]|nr:DUF3784 domain-containing protein [Gammaproteobacteria bacterium]NNJ51038.1 DUF3784 domain-containing protein [Gammaproteobacteria bacterium]